jgi:hypothetical protein
MVTPALASLSSELLDLAANGDPTTVARALTTLHSLAVFDLLPPSDRGHVVALARAKLSDVQAPEVWLAAVELALATGDDELRAIVAAISAGEARLSLPRGIDLHLFVRSAARRALDRAADWTRVPGGVGM